MGITERDMLPWLSIRRNMTEEQREKITPLMIKGFQHAAEEGGQSVVKPWIIVVGCHVVNAECLTGVGDVLLLTNPWEPKLLSVPTNGWIILKEGIREDSGLQRTGRAGFSANRTAVSNGLIHTFNAHVAGFGLLGHSQNFAKQRLQPVWLSG
ncbi:hypothetical protein QTO34_005231 [Cnephaeus nilssonii]|uniref:Uncharacterized protein n=1 Tax=Cnephaeus nilssonii TaxID=3371016 RepID=A0AA40LJM8_CNENI|nr:hypothetical protein QTO34_005231 [Eptesicus nilssonii]